MKRFLSIILTFTMLMSMMSVSMLASAKVYPSIELSSGFASDTIFGVSGGKKAAVYGIGGKASNDESLMMTENANAQTSWLEYKHGEEIYFEDGKPMTGYLVAELNFLAPDAAYMKEFIFGLSGNQQRITQSVTTTIPSFRINQWNHLMMVYYANEDNCDFVDFANDIPNAAAKLGSADLYVNGTFIGTKNLSCTATTYDAAINKILLEVYSGDKKVQHSTYYDDIKLYKTDTAPVAPAVVAFADTDEYTVSGSNVTVAEGASVTVADVKAANPGCEIVVFADNGYTSTLSDDSALSMFNVIVAKSADNVYTYYDVIEPGVTVIGNLCDGSLNWTNKLTYTTVSGIGGKALGDKSALVTSTTTETVEGANSFIQPIVTGMPDMGRYFVLSANMMNVDSKSLLIRTSGHAGVSYGVTFENDFEANEWNKLLIYVDFVESKAYTYVNGVLKGTAVPSSAFASTGIIRFCVEGAAGSQYHIDDFVMYTTNTAPDGVAQTQKPAVDTANGMTCSDGVLKVLPDTTVATLKAANTNAIRVYTDSTLATLAQDTAILEMGMKVAVENAYKTIEIVDVAIFYGENELYFADGSEAHPFPSVVNGTGAAAQGFAGKEASDSILAITPVADTYIAGPNWGKATKKTDTADATWDKANYDGYLVFEASVFNIDNNVLTLVTTQTRAVSGNVAGSVPKNQWSRVKFVYNHKIGDANFGKTITYIDGVAKTGWVNSNLGTLTAYENTEYCTALRFSIKGSTSGTVATYVDDIRIYETTKIRPEESTGFTAVEYTAANGYEFGIVEGKTVSVADLKAANEGLVIKIFESKSNYTEVADTANLVLGNVIVAMAQSTCAADANLAIKDILQVMEVKTISATKDLISGLPTSSVRGNISDAEGVVFGNTSSTIKKVVNNAAENNWYFAYDYKGLSTGMKYLVFEGDFAPSENTDYFFVGANGHAPLSASAEVGDSLVMNRWHKIVVVYNTETDTSDMYVNGKPVSEGFTGTYNSIFAANKNSIQLRMIVHSTGKVAGESYFDDFRLYESMVYPEIGAPAELAEGYSEQTGGFADNVSYTLKVKNGVTADISINGADVTVTDGNDTLLDSAQALSDGSLVVIKKNGNFASYDVSILEDNDIVVLGSTYDDVNAVMTPGELSIYGIPADDAVVIAVQYDENNDIIKIDKNDVTDEAGVITIDFAPEDIDDTKIKVFMFDGLNSIKPLCKNKDIAHTRSYNLLMLGNSFSMDVTCYMEEIAAAMGKDINIGVLNKGGSAVAYHYTNREMNLTSSDIMFWLNDKTQGYSNLKTVLENYEWDYVVFQNWGNSKAFYTNSDSNYAANWKPMVDLAKYVNQLEPNAELMIHETWSFEAGYNDFKDIATRDAIGADIRALYTRCAEECAAAIGQSTPLEKISSLDAFEAARTYVDADGISKFETTYYVNGHKFIDYPNRATVPVGDGSMLLSPEDAAAGKISLHRDGFHASQVGRYLIALNAVRYLTGKDITGNTYRPGEIALDSSAYYGGNEVTDLDNAKGGVIYQKYDAMSDDVAEILQSIVDSME